MDPKGPEVTTLLRERETLNLDKIIPLRRRAKYNSEAIGIKIITFIK